MSSDEEQNLSDKVEILSTEDDKLKTIGEILSSDSSRKILQLLFNQSLSANDIAQKTGLSLPLAIHHLKKMQSAQIVKITNVGKNTKSHDVKYYTIDKFAIVVLPSEMSRPAKKSKSLFNSFNRLHRLATLGAVCVAAWFTTQFLHESRVIVYDGADMKASDETAMMVPAMESEESALQAMPEAARSMPTDDAMEGLQMQAPTGDPSLDVLWSTITVLGIIIAWLAIEVIIKRR